MPWELAWVIMAISVRYILAILLIIHALLGVLFLSVAEKSPVEFWWRSTSLAIQKEFASRCMKRFELLQHPIFGFD